MVKEQYKYNNEILTDKEKLLISLLINKNPTEKDISILTSKMDVAKETQSFLLLLSYLGYLSSWKFFPQNFIPFLKGIYSFYQAKNIFKMSWLIEKIRVLQKANIPVMLLKGLALKYYYETGYPRIMNDFDIAVPEKDYKKAITLLTDKNKYNGQSVPYHGEIDGNGIILEVHRWIFKTHGDKGTDIWERAVNIDFYGTKVCVMCPEDMLIHQLDNRSKDIFLDTFLDRRINFIFDCNHILNFTETIDIKQLYSRAATFSVLYSVKHMLSFISEFFPKKIDINEIEKQFPYPKKYNLWVKNNIKYNEMVANYNLKYGTNFSAPLTISFIFKLLLKDKKDSGFVGSLSSRRVIECFLLYIKYYSLWLFEKIFSSIPFF
ncbi:MAG: nucleotidyltransferase family protein [Endomicrobiaceae bacterium]|nr:nucleotidyltransferase family protein [Endomicrobiaceae bacterium]